MVNIAKIEPSAEPAKYFPFSSGAYDTKPNLFQLGHDFGNGEADKKVLQIDKVAAVYRQQKLDARQNNFQDHCCYELPPHDPSSKAINRFLVGLYLSEYPHYFRLDKSDTRIQLSCFLSGEVLLFDKEYAYLDCSYFSKAHQPAYQSGLDALACQIQEDICLVKFSEQGDRLIAGHLCFPNRWSLPDKIGKDFVAVHKPVSEFAHENRHASRMLNVLLDRGPYVRFAWGFSNDRELNHSPGLTEPVSFSGQNDSLFVRIERQTLVGIPQKNLLAFFIRTYYLDCHELLEQQYLVTGLYKALKTMSPGTLTYKGLAGSYKAIQNWLLSSIE